MKPIVKPQTEPRQTHRAELGTLPDGELLRLYSQQHSEEAFAVLGRRYANLIYATCLREMGEPGRAEDAAQMVALLLSRKAARLTHYTTLAGWLYRASCLTCRNVRRQQARRKAAEENAAMLEAITHAAPRNELWERIEPHFHDALDRLKPGDREAVLLRYMQEQSLSEVGASLGISENTARMRVNRSLEKIRLYLVKAGIAFSAGTLVALLEARAAQAAPSTLISAMARIATPGSSPLPQGLPSNQAAIFFQRLAPPPASFRYFAASFSVVLVMAVGVVSYRHFQPQRASREEQQRLFVSLAGTWQGTIRFADDSDQRLYTYPTSVRFSTDASGQTLRFASTYAGSPRVDTVVFAADPRTGLFSVRNSGAQISHGIDGEGELIRYPTGVTAFRGRNRANTSEIRLQFTLRGTRLVVLEEYRLVDSFFSSALSRYTFRNQYTLQRADNRAVAQ